MEEASDEGNIVELAGEEGVASVGGVSLSKQLDFNNQRFNLRVNGLYGCAVAIVISKRGMWAAHFWEFPGFINMKVVNNQLCPESPTTDQEFTDRERNFIF